MFPLGGAPELTDLGYVGQPQRPYDLVTIAVGTTAAVFCVPPNAFVAPHGSPMQMITDPDFPGASSVAYLDGYFGFSAFGDDGRWFISQLLDPFAFDALDFAFSDAVPNVLRLVLAHRGEFWLIGQKGIEAWYDAGNQDFPFRRRPGAVIDTGVYTPRSVTTADGSVFFIGADNIVYRTGGTTAYQVRRISTHAIEQIIEASGVSADWAFSFSREGHVFYVMTAGIRTLVYDCATQAWHERSSSIDASTCWRIRCAAQFGSAFMLCDSLSGRIYFPDERLIATDDGMEVMRHAAMPPLWAGTARAFCSRLEVELEAGTNDRVRLDWTDDGGNTYHGPRSMNTGPAGAGRHRAYTTRLGSFRQRVFRLSTWGRTVFYAVDCAITAGSN